MRVKVKAKAIRTGKDQWCDLTMCKPGRTVVIYDGQSFDIHPYDIVGVQMSDTMMLTFTPNGIETLSGMTHACSMS
jgi:hypothetical protein